MWKVSDGLFPLAFQTDEERQPEGRCCRTRAPADRNPNLSGTWAGQQTSVELATNLIQEANSLSLHGLDDIYAKMVLVSLFLSTTALFCNFCFILDSEARVSEPAPPPCRAAAWFVRAERSSHAARSARGQNPPARTREEAQPSWMGLGAGAAPRGIKALWTKELEGCGHGSPQEDAGSSSRRGLRRWLGGTELQGGGGLGQHRSHPTARPAAGHSGSLAAAP